MRERANQVNKNAVAVVRTNFRCKEKLVDFVQQKYSW